MSESIRWLELNKHQRALAAARAAKRIPIVGTAVVLAPFAQAWSEQGATLSNLTQGATLHGLFNRIARNFTGFDPGNPSGTVDSVALIRTYGPIFAYLIARRVAGKHITRVFRPLGLRF